MQNLFSGFFKNIARCFTPRNLLFHGLAIILTYIIVMSGFDWAWFIYFHGTQVYNFFFPSVFVGFLLPFILPLVLYAIGYASKQTRLFIAGHTLAQSAMIGYLISTTYKVFTGRIPPSFTDFTIDISHGFRLGFLRGGIFWGWPSTHTTVAFAMVFSLIALFPRSKIIRYLTPLYTLYIGLGVSMSIHWFSEFVAGAIIGALIGLVIGKNFREKFLTEKM